MRHGFDYDQIKRDTKRPEPLNGKTLYTAQVTTGETAQTNFVSKEVFDSVKDAPYSIELFEKDKVKSAVEWLKSVIYSDAKAYGLKVEDVMALRKRVDDAFPDVVD